MKLAARLTWLLLLPSNACAYPAVDAAAVKTQANVVCEFALQSAHAHADPFNDITLDAIFTDPRGMARRVPAFWAGGNVWKLRYASPLVGTHAYRTECSDPSDGGLNGVIGQ